MKEFLKKFLSVKGTFAILATVLLFLRLIPDWYFLLSWSLFIGAREIQEAIRIIKGN